MSQPMEINLQSVVQRLSMKLAQAHTELAMNETGVEQLSQQLTQAQQKVQSLEAQLADAKADAGPDKEGETK